MHVAAGVAAVSVAAAVVIRTPGSCLCRRTKGAVRRGSGVTAAGRLRFAVCAAEGSSSKGARLERWTERRPQEVLAVTAEVDGEEDYIVVFKGFSSSLIRPTAVDPGEPVLAEDATIVSIDRMQAPYNPDQPQYVAQGLTWEAFEGLLLEAGL
eukprot:jgi/Chlat1/4946/Chrsp32S04922